MIRPDAHAATRPGPPSSGTRPRLAAILLATSVPAATAAEVGFNRDIRPILNRHCTACHGGVKEAGGISFVFRDKALATGESGRRTIVPGDPDGSELIRRVTSTDPDLVMPQPEHGPPLAPGEIDKLRAWIRQGAEWQDHWAFVPPADHPPPAVENTGWPRNPIDHHVLARLEKENLRPNPEAEPALLLRRLSIDLTGLPPSPAEIDAFEAAARTDPEAAWQREITRLLESPHYGERWASTWLDLARYADTEGLGHDQPRPAWPYRDWVIRAFNDDLPFDQFTIKQLAGDLLPEPTLDDLIATNFHRQSQNNGEGGADDEEFRVAAVMDRVAVTWEAWQGVTMACVQCHDHPYDPIIHRDYYSSLAFFNNTRDYDLSEHFPKIPVPKDPADAARFASLWNERLGLLRQNHAQQHTLRQATTWQAPAALAASSSQVPIEVRPIDGNPGFHTAGTVPTGTTIELSLTPTDAPGDITALRIEFLPVDPATAIHTPEWGAVLSSVQLHHRPTEGPEVPLAIDLVIGDESDPFFDPRLSLDDSPRGWGAYPKIDRPRSCVLVFRRALPAAGSLRLTLAHRLNAALSIPMVPKRGRVFLSRDPRWTALANDPGHSRALARIAEIDASLAGGRSMELPVMAAVDPHLERPTHVFLRGNWLDKDAANHLRPQVPELFGSLPSGAPADRLTLARWLVSADNPLTARVAVNRLWQQLFGTGLVETPEDFGSAGSEPSHPELLDHLALRFRQHHRWSQKAMLREIVSSATYRQSSAAGPAAAADPHNRLLARGPRIRLSAEAIRDHGLAASGLLAPTLFGPPVFPPMPEGGWTPFESRETWDSPPPGDPARYRRALYTYTKRSNPYPGFTQFDAPTRDLCTQRRILSNTPLQALETLNSPAHAEFAAALARRMRDAHPADPAAMITLGHRLTTSRPPSPERLARLLELHQSIEPPDKALTTVATVLLNLDDALVK